MTTSTFPFSSIVCAESIGVAVFAYLDDTIVGVPAELAGTALPVAAETFARAGHTVHPGKSASWSHSADRATLPAECQRIWQANGLKVGGIPVFNRSESSLLVTGILEKRLQKIEEEETGWREEIEEVKKEVEVKMEHKKKAEMEKLKRDYEEKIDELVKVGNQNFIINGI